MTAATRIATSVLMEPFVDQLRSVPFLLASEKSGQLARLVFNGQEWTFEALKSSPASQVQHFGSNPPKKYLWVTYAGLTSVWCVSLYAACLIRIVSTLSGTHEGPVDLGRALAEAQEYIEFVRKLRLNDLDWPSNLAVRPSLSDPLLADVNNIFFGAMGLILLHEIAHMSKRHQIHLPENLKIGQENEADDFAGSWIFADVADPRQREFRILVAGIALAWLLLMEPPGGAPEHPPAHVRVQRISQYFGASADSPALEVVSHLLKAVLFPSEQPPPSFSRSTDLFDWTIDRLRERQL
ncbi:phage exclusion protein Lit family protein [Bradyrhizobium sp. AZCC 1721]|uniref:phage exclusion protein Lit family protein n=1 Tax=Bradyrhizobium sp. AZCC 1721 TaxID=3117016 RepID=UPI002FF3C4E9